MSIASITHKGARIAGLLALAIGLVWVASVSAITSDGELESRFEAEGNYGIVLGGIGMRDDATAQIVVDVPGTPQAAYLYWAGLDAPGSEDNAITVALNGDTPVNITFDIEHGPFVWEPTIWHFVFLKDLVSAGFTLQQGTNTFDISGFDLALGTGDRYGAGVLVVYEDLSLPATAIRVQDGLDSVYHGFTPPLGPNSEVHCIQFPAAAEARLLDYYFFAAGVRVDEGSRPVRLWSVTGSGALPTTVINNANRTEITHATDDFVFDSHSGPQWDTFTHEDATNGALNVPAGDSWACFQIESVPDDPRGDGASLILIALGGAIRPPQEPQPQTYTLGDFVWIDTDEDGIQDAGEPVPPTTIVRLYNADTGALLATTSTNASGFYQFSDLPPGNYQLEFVLPAGYTFTLANQGGNDAVDSDVNPATGRTAVIALGAASDPTWDAGLVPTEPGEPQEPQEPTEPEQPSAERPPAESPAGEPQIAIQVLDPSCTKAGDLAQIGPGEIATWTLTAFNPSQVAAANVVIDDPLDATLFGEVIAVTTAQGDYTIDGLRVVFNIGTLQPGQTVEMSIQARARADLPGPQVNRNIATIGATDRGSSTCIVGLPATGYPPADEPAPNAGPDVPVAILAGALGLAVLGVWIVTRRR